MQPPANLLSRMATGLYVTLLAGISLSAPNWAEAQSVPPLINYQGRLTDSSGMALPSGTYAVAFRLWDTQSLVAGQTLVWGREYDVTIIEGGAFNVILGAAGGRTLADNPPPAVNNLGFGFSQSNRFLGLTIARDANGEAVPNPRELVPRQQILSAPFALMAQNLAAGTLTQVNVDPAFLLDILQPPGTIEAFGGTNIPAGWLLCDGRAVSSNSFPRLFAAISTNWGTGIPASANNFNLPDLRGLFLRGVDASGVNDPDYLSRTNRSGVQAANVGSLQGDNFKTHTHPVADTGPTGAIQGGSLRVIQNSHPLSISPALIGGTGGNETRPKNAYVNYIIKY